MSVWRPPLSVPGRKPLADFIANAAFAAVSEGLNQAQICRCFNRLFAASHKVHLRGGGAEPNYTPASGQKPSLIVAREDFAASALHEAAHWCVASQERRLRPDYGYRYQPPPREKSDQIAFFDSEFRVQAVECYLSNRAGVKFRASADDPDFALAALDRFQLRIESLVQRWENGEDRACAPPRAQRLATALQVDLRASQAVQQ